MYRFGWVSTIIGLMTSYNGITRTGVQTGAVANWCCSTAWFEGRLKFNLPFSDSGMFYDDFGRLNCNLPTASYRLIKSHLFLLAYARYCS